MKIETHPKHAGCYFVYNDKNEFVATLNTNSWDDFEKSIHNITKGKYREGRKWADKLADYFLHNLRREFFDLIPLTYLWTLKSGYIKIAQLYETRIFPHIAHKISIQEGRRWLFAYDSMITPDDRVELFIELMKEEKAGTQHDRIERMVALHGLFICANTMSSRFKERVYVMYMDFIKQEENSAIERLFGETIEADFVRMKNVKKDISEQNKSNDDSNWFIDNWLMRRYALDEVLRNVPRWALPISGLLLWITAVILSILLPDNKNFPTHLYDYKIVFLIIFMSLFLIGWYFWKGVKLSKLVWGCIIGWLLILSEAIGNIVRTEYDYKHIPQIMQLNNIEILLSFFLFLGTAFLIISWEIKEANIRIRKKRNLRIVSIIFSGMYFSILEGGIFVCFLSWLFREPYCCWYFRWDALMLALGTPMALVVGIITQLVWESRRLTEIVRK